MHGSFRSEQRSQKLKLFFEIHLVAKERVTRSGVGGVVTPVIQNVFRNARHHAESGACLV